MLDEKVSPIPANSSVTTNEMTKKHTICTHLIPLTRGTDPTYTVREAMEGRPNLR